MMLNESYKNITRDKSVILKRSERCRKIDMDSEDDCEVKNELIQKYLNIDRVNLKAEIPVNHTRRTNKFIYRLKESKPEINKEHKSNSGFTNSILKNLLSDQNSTEENSFSLNDPYKDIDESKDNKSEHSIIIEKPYFPDIKMKEKNPINFSKKTRRHKNFSMVIPDIYNSNTKIYKRTIKDHRSRSTNKFSESKRLNIYLLNGIESVINNRKVLYNRCKDYNGKCNEIFRYDLSSLYF